MALEGVQWSIRIPREPFEALRGEESFRQALALGRFLDSFRFVQDSFLQGQRDQPAGARQRITGFCFVAGFEDRQGELFYELSDLLALDLFIDEYSSTVQQLNRAKALMERTTKFAIQLAGAAEAVLNVYVQSNGFTVSQSADSGGAA